MSQRILVSDDGDDVVEERGAVRIYAIAHARLVAGDHEVRRRRQRDLERSGGVGVEKGRLVGGQLPGLVQRRAGDARGRGLGRAVGSLPFEQDAVLGESIDGVGHVGQPRSAPQLAVAQDVEADLTLPAQGIGDGEILERPQLRLGNPALRERRPRLEQLRRTKQAPDLFGAISFVHFAISN